MAWALPNIPLSEVDDVLTCAVDLEHYNSTDRKPLQISCSSRPTFCAGCIDRLLDQHDDAFPCPLDREPVSFRAGVSAARQFCVDRTLMRLVETIEGRGSEDETEAADQCHDHSGKKKDYFCIRCKDVVCPSCALREHKFHNVVDIQDVVREAKEETLSACTEIDEFIEHVRARVGRMRAKLEDMQAKENQTHRRMDEVFHRLSTYIQERKDTAWEDFRARVKTDRMKLEEDLAKLESLGSWAQSTVDSTRRKASEGPYMKIMGSARSMKTFLTGAQQQNRQVRERDVRYEVNERDLATLTQTLGEYGEVLAVEDDCDLGDGVEEPVTARNVIPTVSTTLLHIQPGLSVHCPDILLDASCCGADCTLGNDGVSVTNQPSVLRPRSSLPFPGSRSTEPLFGNHSSLYWVVRIDASPSPEGDGVTRLCEVGVASSKAMKAVKGNDMFSSAADRPALTVRLWREHGKTYCVSWSGGRHLGTCCLQDSCDSWSPTHVTLAFLFNVGQRHVYVINVSSGSVLCQSQVEMSDPLWPVFRLWPLRECKTEVRLRVQTGQKVLMKKETADLLKDFLPRSITSRIDLQHFMMPSAHRDGMERWGVDVGGGGGVGWVGGHLLWV